jgi:endonuclease V-like protein UPF0215 family
MAVFVLDNLLPSSGYILFYPEDEGSRLLCDNLKYSMFCICVIQNIQKKTGGPVLIEY